jgi:hypothetical protein
MDLKNIIPTIKYLNFIAENTQNQKKSGLGLTKIMIKILSQDYMRIQII